MSALLTGGDSEEECERWVEIFLMESDFKSYESLVEGDFKNYGSL